MAILGPPYPIPGTYVNSSFFAGDTQPLTFETLRKAMRALRGEQEPEPVKVEPVAAAPVLEPTARACPDCGEWNGCLCPWPESLPHACYVCAHGMGARPGTARPLVCAGCKKTYLEGK